MWEHIPLSPEEKKQTRKKQNKGKERGPSMSRQNFQANQSTLYSLTRNGLWGPLTWRVFAVTIILFLFFSTSLKERPTFLYSFFFFFFFFFFNFYFFIQKRALLNLVLHIFPLQAHIGFYLPKHSLLVFPDLNLLLRGSSRNGCSGGSSVSVYFVGRVGGGREWWCGDGGHVVLVVEADSPVLRGNEGA
jgi:hypothetical protein